MSSKTLNLLTAAAIFLSSSVAVALPFSSFDSRSMAMGGAGVAVGGVEAAPLFNPALLSVAKDDDHFGLILPTIGIRIADPDKLRDSIDAFQAGNYVNNLTNSISTLNSAITTANATPTAPNIAAVQSAALVASGDLSKISTQLLTLSNKPITVDGGIATVVGIPSKNFGVAFYANGIVATGGLFIYSAADSTLINNLAVQAAACSTTPSTCTTALTTFNTTTLTSGISFRGATLVEFGFSLSREFKILNHDIALGITPKIIRAQLFDVPISVNNSNQSNVSSADYMAEYKVANFDLGAAKNYGNGWRTGLVIKNVIPQALDFKRAPTLGVGATPVATGDQLILKPQARIGVSHENGWSTLALDVDLTRNDPAGFEKATRYIALGGELNAFGWAQLRAGYRLDTENSARNVASVGLGISPFGIHADVAVAGNANEVGASFQLGFHF